MYKIRGQDQEEFGPCTAEVVRQWITARRASADTLVCRAGESTWQPLSDLPEFQDALVQRPTVSPRSAGPRRSRGVPSVRAETCGWGVASVALGLVGFLGITGLIGLVLGIMALKRISRSEGQWKGLGWAIVGTVLSGSMFLLSIPALAGLVWVPMMKVRQQNAELGCYDNLRGLNAAIQTYAASHGGLFPDANTWSDQLIQASLLSAANRAFQCPTRLDSLCSYAFNRHLSGLNITNVNKRTVALFESDLGWNGNGDAKNLVSSRHGTYLIVGFADGSVEAVPAWQLSQLRWLPQTPP